MCSLHLIEGWHWSRRSLECWKYSSDYQKRGNVIIKSGVTLRKTLLPEGIPLWLTQKHFSLSTKQEIISTFNQNCMYDKTYRIYREWGTTQLNYPELP